MAWKQAIKKWDEIIEEEGEEGLIRIASEYARLNGGVVDPKNKVVITPAIILDAEEYEELEGEELQHLDEMVILRTPDDFVDCDVIKDSDGLLVNFMEFERAGWHLIIYEHLEEEFGLDLLRSFFSEEWSESWERVEHPQGFKVPDGEIRVFYRGGVGYSYDVFKFKQKEVLKWNQKYML